MRSSVERWPSMSLGLPMVAPMLSRRMSWRGGRAGLLSAGMTLTSEVENPASSKPREIRLTV